jgi:hypothetical protein
MKRLEQQSQKLRVRWSDWKDHYSDITGWKGDYSYERPAKARKGLPFPKPKRKKK